MTITRQEFDKVYTGKADKELRQRVLKAMREDDPVVCGFIDENRQRAMAWLGLTANTNQGIPPMLKQDQTTGEHVTEAEHGTDV